MKIKSILLAENRQKVPLSKLLSFIIEEESYDIVYFRMCRLHYEAMTECVRVPRAPPDVLGASFFNGSAAGVPTPTPTPAPGAPRQKGRPRKRKPKDLEAMTANLGEILGSA